MSLVEIPLLRESSSFAARLRTGCARHGGGVYHQARRVNWSYRFSELFYEAEAAFFTAQPEQYLDLDTTSSLDDIPQVGEPNVEDVYAQPLGARDVAKIFLKVGAHWLFSMLGALAFRRACSHPYKTLRKGYVEDIELVFDPDSPDVLRLIFPFPLGVKRQGKYLRRLRREARPFALCGVPYSPADLLVIVRKRNMGAVQRMETRAQLRLARKLGQFQARIMEISDEFDIGCLDFCRGLHRVGFKVVNSAHGVGKYLPVHAFDHFSVLTRQQEIYYTALRPCKYDLRSLNGAAPATPVYQPDDPVNLVILGQAASHVSPVLQAAETDLLERTKRHFQETEGLALFYKPHPNNLASSAQKAGPETGQGVGITIVNDLKAINGHPKTIFCSFFSTCQVDPAFSGEKYLLRAPLIYPEIAFDPDQMILDIEAMLTLVQTKVKQNAQAG